MKNTPERNAYAKCLQLSRNEFITLNLTYKGLECTLFHMDIKSQKIELMTHGGDQIVVDDADYERMCLQIQNTKFEPVKAF